MQLLVDSRTSKASLLKGLQWRNGPQNSSRPSKAQRESCFYGLGEGGEGLHALWKDLLTCRKISMGLKTFIQSCEEWQAESKDQKLPSTRSEFSTSPIKHTVVFYFVIIIFFISKSHPKQAAFMYVFLGIDCGLAHSQRLPPLYEAELCSLVWTIKSHHPPLIFF